MTDGAMLSFPAREHAHLKLAAAVAPGARKRFASGGGSRVPRYPNRSEHARVLQDQAINVKSAFRRRPPVLGLDPELVLVLETHRQIRPDDLGSTQLQVLEFGDGAMMVTFASDPELQMFLERAKLYGQGARGFTGAGNERPAWDEALFDTIASIRALTVADVLSLSIQEVLASATEAESVRVDIQCWCPDDSEGANRRHDEVMLAVTRAGGVVHAHSLRVQAGLSVIVADVPAGRIRELARVDRVRRIDVMPRPLMSHPQARSAELSDLPVVLPPAVDAPIVGIIDSGIRSAHPLIAPAVLEADYLDITLGDAGDASGHGTLVASLALYGSLEQALDSGRELKAAGRLVSVRVLDENDHFPDDKVWESHLLEAMTRAADAGARVVNLSLGDARHPYRPPRPTALAALIDEFSRHRNVVVVVSAGNYSLVALNIDSLISNTYVKDLLESDDSGVLDPGSAALALTIGALCGDSHQGAAAARPDADRVPVGRPGMPSPFTRLGPGPMNMVKPELMAPGGSVSVDSLMRRVITADHSMSVVGAGGRDINHLLAMDAGTSMAAPLATHTALRVLSRYPSLTGNSVRALLLVSAEPLEIVVEGVQTAEALSSQRRLTGYGRVSPERAESSEDHRAVLLGEGAIPIDGVHLYVVPIPEAFRATGRRTITVALAYDPPVRATRFDYLASRMNVFAYHGATLHDVQQAFAAAPNLGSDEVESSAAELSPASLAKHKLALLPSDTDRGRGTNQVGAFSAQQAFRASWGNEIIIAIRSVNRWDLPDTTQSYAVAAAFEYQDPLRGNTLYAELHARFDALAEIELEAEI